MQFFYITYQNNSLVKAKLKIVVISFKAENKIVLRNKLKN